MSRSAIDMASDVTGEVAAARMREKFLRQRANAPNDERREELGDAIGTLEVRFPSIEDLPAGGAEKFARERGHGTRAKTHEGRRRPRQPDAKPLERAANRAGSPKPPARKPSPPAGRDTSSRGSSRSDASRRRPATPRSTGGGRGAIERRLRSRGGQAWRETGIPATGASVSGVVMSFLGATVGLAAAYLLLVSAERGNDALPSALSFAGGVLRRVIAPEDFFGRGLTPLQYAAAENPHGNAATVESSLAAGHLHGPLKPGIKVDGHPVLPRQLGFKK